MAEKKEQVKCVVVGDSYIGKTCMLYSYKNHSFPEDYVPTVFNNDRMSVSLDDRLIDLTLCDTAGTEEYDRLRPLSYPMASVFLLCFAVNSVPSLEACRTKWIAELSHFAEGVPVLLCGLKSDLRDSEETIKFHERRGEEYVTKEQAEELVVEFGLKGYFECSALKREGLEEVFDEVIRIALSPRPRRRLCVIL